MQRSQEPIRPEDVQIQINHTTRIPGGTVWTAEVRADGELAYDYSGAGPNCEQALFALIRDLYTDLTNGDYRRIIRRTPEPLPECGRLRLDGDWMCIRTIDQQQCEGCPIRIQTDEEGE